jgi:hypothetical protein
MIVVWARDSPRSAIISTRSRKLSLYRRYQRTQRTMISRSKCRPLKISSTLNMPVSFTESYAGAKYAGLLIFAPQPDRLSDIVCPCIVCLSERPGATPLRAAQKLPGGGNSDRIQADTSKRSLDAGAV